MSAEIEKIYQKLKHEEHILTIPDTYIGSVEKNEGLFWEFNDTDTKVFKKTMTIIPGLYKIFDEILVNAYDQYIRLMQKLSKEKKKQFECGSEYKS